MVSGDAGATTGHGALFIPPGKQLQADFAQCVVAIAGERVLVHLCVLTLGYSRRMVVRAYAYERHENWLRDLEEAFRH